MANNLLRRLSCAFQRFEQTINIILGRGFPPGAVCAVDCNDVAYKLQSPIYPSNTSISDIINNGFMWAVPKQRRTIEKRLKRRFGVPKYHWKPHVPRTDIISCLACGFHHELDVLCKNCYEKVKQATREKKEEIYAALKLNELQPELDVVVLSQENPIDSKVTEELKQELAALEQEKKKKLNWFEENLLESTPQKTSERTDVKPKDMV